MSRVPQKNTAPEMVVRRIVHKMGYRYGLHSKDLLGKPDIVFRRRRKVIFVHGCYWHGHSNPSCRLARVPKTRTEFWKNKISRNAERDREIMDALTRQGWNVLVVWECETLKGVHSLLLQRLTNFLT